MRNRLSTKYPVILAHGYLGTDTFLHKPFRIDYWRGIKEHLHHHGATVLITRVPPGGSVQVRAESLRQQICDFKRAGWIKDKVNLVGHSMGGLDARYLVSALDGRDYVASVTTLATPHRGSPCIDFFDKYTPFEHIVASILKGMGQGDNSGFHCLHPRALEQFNLAHPNVSHIPYFSYTASSSFEKMPALLMPTHKIIYDLEGENDGCVSVSSASWGRVLGHLNVDHLQLANWHLSINAQRFDALEFYSKHLEFLQKNDC